MPIGYPTLLDVAKLDAGEGYDVINEVISSSKELEIFPAETIVGATMELSVRTKNPEVGFRNANQGSPRSKAEFKNKVFQCMPIEQQVAIDYEGVLKAAKEPGKLQMEEVSSHMEAILSHISKQIWYGTGNDDKGFPGMIAQHSTSAEHNFDAGGTTNKTSIWYLDLGPGKISTLYGNEESITTREWDFETALDAKSNPFLAFATWIAGRVGMRLANKNKAVRIKSVSTEADKGATDDLLAEGLSLAEELNMQPTHIFMNPRSRKQLRDSRSAFHPTGQPVPFPSDYEGIPIISTINISKNES